MHDLGFALDGLYAAGWWPSDSDDCRLSEDSRWYPSHNAILSEFTRRGIDLVITMPLSGHPVTVRWSTPQSGAQTVTARTQTEALLLAFARSFPRPDLYSGLGSGRRSGRRSGQILSHTQN
ncbi:MAG: hypothetical protein CMJ25_13255 [Phycisphaerae bacterium]|nr:hypothetical protein [Phycisphaerae bacterium]